MPPSRPSAFAATRWTLVLEAGAGTPQARAALGELCDIYYAPVVAFIGQTAASAGLRQLPAHIAARVCAGVGRWPQAP